MHISGYSRKPGAALFMALVVSAPLAMAQRADGTGKVDVQRDTSIELYRPPAPVMEACEKAGTGEAPALLIGECGRLRRISVQRADDVLGYSRVVLEMGSRMNAEGRGTLVERLRKGEKITRREYGHIKNYISYLKIARDRINNDNRKMAAESGNVAWYLENHYRPIITHLGVLVEKRASSDLNAGHLNRARMTKLSRSEWKEDTGIRLDGRVLKVCGLPSPYMLPLNVFSDCARLSAGLGMPSLMPHYNSKESEQCSEYGYSQKVPLEEKRKIIANALARYKDRVPDKDRIQKLESDIMQFYTPGRENVEEGLERCPYYRPISFYLERGAELLAGFLLLVRLFVYLNARRR